VIPYIRVAYAGDLLFELEGLRRSSFIDNELKPVERKEKGSPPPLGAPWLGYASAELKAASAERLSKGVECMPPF